MQINGQPIKEADLRPSLEDIFKTRATKVVFVKGDPDVDYRYVAQAVDDAKGAGLDKVGYHDAQSRGWAVAEDGGIENAKSNVVDRFLSVPACFCLRWLRETSVARPNESRAYRRIRTIITLMR